MERRKTENGLKRKRAAKPRGKFVKLETQVGVY
jgi:hypothetical protein